MNSTIASRWTFLIAVTLAGAVDSHAAVILGGGPRGTDCLAAVVADGTAFPAGGAARGVTCVDGDACDADGTRDGVCHVNAAVCVDVVAPGCRTATVQRLGVTGKHKGISGADGEAFFGQVMALNAAAGAIGLPIDHQACTPVVPVPVFTGGPNGQGVFVRGSAELRVKARTSRGNDRDVARVVCLPNGTAITTTTVTTSTTTTTTTSTATSSSTTLAITTTTSGATATTTQLTPPGPPGAGLQATILSTTIGTDRKPVVTFSLVDGSGVPVTPIGSSTTDERKARVRFTIAHLDEVTDTFEDQLSTTFTKYLNYITSNQTSPITHNSSAQPTYDSGGVLAVVDPVAGTYRYTFRTALPADYPATHTHTVGAQIERTYQGTSLVANPIFDFVPAGGAPSVERIVTPTSACNGCHDPLSAHGGGRREVRLCQLCHTDQAVDPDTGNTIDFKVMVHRIHRAKELPSVADGAVGAHYSIIGFNQNEVRFGEKVDACAGGGNAGLPCTTNADCPSGTCTGSTTTGIGFPRDIRDCTVCHKDAPEADNYKTKPSATACASCHDDVNPGKVTTDAGAPGTNHVAMDQPDALCRICHTPTGDDFDISVPGAHVIPERAAVLTGLHAELLSASGTAGGTVTITFRVRNDAGTALDVRSGFSRVAMAMSGPSTDFGGASKVVITPTIAGSGSSGTLSAPDVDGIHTYTTSAGNALPGDATGTWRVGLEMRRTVSVNGSNVNEAAANPVLDFSVDGSPVAPRRTVVATERCENCHGEFSKGFSVHGNLRNQTDYCVICHNPNANDSARRIPAVLVGADTTVETIDLKHLIHKIHTGEELTQQPYVVYGFGTPSFTPHDFGEVRFPGDRRDCATCHVGNSQLLPLPSGVLPTRQSAISSGADSQTGTIPAITDACTSCHDDAAVAAHAATNTTAGGAEACTVCHGEGSIAAVSAVHAR